MIAVRAGFVMPIGYRNIFIKQIGGQPNSLFSFLTPQSPECTETGNTDNQATLE